MKLSILLCTISMLGYIFCYTNSYTAEPNEKVHKVFVDDDTSVRVSAESAYQIRTVKDVYKNVIVKKNQELIASNLHITSLRGLYVYRQEFALDTLTIIKVNSNKLKEDDLWIILGQVHNLSFLDVSDNVITQLDLVPYHNNLQKILLHNNQIQSLHVQKFFSRLVGLKHVSFHNNQLTPHTITHVVGTAPNVEELWFDSTALDDKLTKEFMIFCPRLLQANMIRMSSDHV